MLVKQALWLVAPSQEHPQEPGDLPDQPVLDAQHQKERDDAEPNPVDPRRHVQRTAPGTRSLLKDCYCHNCL